MPRRSLLEYVDRFYRHGSETAYVHRRGYRTARWSYRQIAETACQFARDLEVRQVNKGDRVLIWGANCAEWVAGFWGCLLRGAVVVPMDQTASNDFALRVCRQVEARLAVCSRELARQPLPLPTMIMETMPETVARHDRSPYAMRELAGHETARKDIAEIIFTSGTTADPKGVILSHGNVLANLEPLEAEINRYRKYERLVHPLRFLSLLPLSHVFGQFLGLFVPPLLAATVIFQDTLNPSEVVRGIRREQVSVLIAVPRLLDALKAKIERDLEAEGRLSWFTTQFEAAAEERFFRRWWRFRRIHNKFGWRFIALISGGATLDPAIEAFWSRLGFAVIQGYGLTETTSIISVNHPFRLSRGSIGQVLPGREVKLDESGEILVRGESIASGYWSERKILPVLSAAGEKFVQAGEDEWFHTGDLGVLDERGNLYFKGRKKNVIVTSEGMNVYPEDLEAALRRQPEVKDCVVVGIESGGREEPCAVLISRAKADDGLTGDGAVGAEGGNDPEAIVHRANQFLAEYQRMRSWFVWPAEDFPRTSTLKPQIHLIREAVQAARNQKSKATHSGQAGTDVGPAIATGDFLLADLIRRVTGRTAAALSPGARLEADLNLGSLDRVELLGAIEDRYQVELNETRFAAATTVGDLERMIRQPLTQTSNYSYPRWTQRWPVASMRFVIYYLLVWPATVLRAKPRIRGREKLTGFRGPLLIVSNHVTEIDVGFILFALPFRLRHRVATAMNGEHLLAMRHPPKNIGWLRRCLDRLGYLCVVALFNVFPLPRHSGFRESFQFAGESADRDYSVLIFPEGEITKDGQVGAFRPGIGVLANKLNVPIVPIRIDGLFELKLAGKKFAPFGAVKVTIGPPMRFEPGADPAAIAKELQARVVSLGNTH